MGSFAKINSRKTLKLSLIAKNNWLRSLKNALYSPVSGYNQAFTWKSVISRSINEMTYSQGQLILFLILAKNFEIIYVIILLP